MEENGVLLLYVLRRFGTCHTRIKTRSRQFSNGSQNHIRNMTLLQAAVNNKSPNRYSVQGFDVRFYARQVDDFTKSLINFYEFSEVNDKNKKSFNELIRIYSEKFTTRKGVVDFIYTALRHMKEFGVADDLESYKNLINLMPKGKYVPSNRIQVLFQYFPREQDCITFLLSQMEVHGVCPDLELGEILNKTFGPTGTPTKKFYRMMYWIPKFKNLNPWPWPRPMPKETFAIAKLAIEKITSVDLQTEITVFRSEDIEASIDKTWIISGQSPTQKRLLENHDPRKPVIVEGGDSVYVKDERTNYFILKSEELPILDAKKEPDFDPTLLENRFLDPDYKVRQERSLHEQDDGIIYAVCATGTSTKDSLLSWIRLLQQHGNPILDNLAILFRFTKHPGEVAHISTSLKAGNQT